MNSRRSIHLVAIVSVVLLVAADIHDAQARGGRGGRGGGYSRGMVQPRAAVFRPRGGAEARSSAGGQRQQKAVGTAHRVAAESANTA